MESTTKVTSLNPGGATGTPAAAAGPGQDMLRVGEIMSQNVVTATPDDTVFSAAQRMSEQNVSCIVVTYRGRVVGLLTEKDMLNVLAGQRSGLTPLGVSGQMSSPVRTVAPETLVLEADRIMETRGVRRLPVLEDGRLVGIVTQTDIARALVSRTALGRVSEIMTKPVVTVPAEAMTSEAARTMFCSNLSCLLVMREQTAAGVLTEKDLLKRVVALQKDLTTTCVADVMSAPVVTIPGSCSILETSKKMETMHFHHLFIADSQGVCGVVTQTDIVSAVRRSLGSTESQQRTLPEELSDLLQRAIRDLQRVRDFLAGIPHPPSPGAGPTCAAAPALEKMVSSAPSLSER